MPQFPRSFSLASLLLILPTLTGCLTWRTVNRPVPEAVQSLSGKHFRVGLVSGLRFEVDSGVVRLDSLVVWHPKGDGSPRSFPLSEVRVVQAKKFNLAKPLLAFGVVTGITAVAWAITCSSESDPVFCG